MEKTTKVIQQKVNGGMGAVYGLGVIGALFYFLQSASTFQEGIIGFIKSILWPAFLIYSLLGFLNV